VEVGGGARLASKSSGPDAGAAGEVKIEASAIALNGATLNTSVESLRDDDFEPASIRLVATNSVSLTDSLLDARTSGTVDAGSVTIQAKSIDIVGGRQPGDLAGDVTLPANTAIVTSTSSGANAGRVAVQGEAILVKNAFVSSQTSSSGDAGKVCIEAGTAQCDAPVLLDDDVILA